MLDRRMLSSAIRYELRQLVLNARYKQKKPSGAFQTPGGVNSIQQHERGCTVICARGAIKITFVAPDCIQVRFLPSPSAKFQVPFSYSVAKATWPDVPFTLTETDMDATVSAAGISCQIERTTGKLTFRNAQKRVISCDEEPVTWREGEFSVTRALPIDETCLGLGGQPVGIDLRGNRFTLWNTDPMTLERNSDPSYSAIPFYLGVYKDFAYGIFWDNPGRGWIDVGAGRKDRLTFSG